MKKEEILDNHFKGAESIVKKQDWYSDVIEAMQEYSDLQNKELTDRLAEKDKEIERLKNTVGVMQEQDSQLQDLATSVEDIEIELGFGLDLFVEKYKWLLHAIESWKKEEDINIEHVKQLQSELTELKEKHKGDVNDAFIVMATGGKHDEVYRACVKLFSYRQEAEKYCAENTDQNMDEKYWTYCEIIEHGIEYEISRYKNYPRK